MLSFALSLLLLALIDWFTHATLVVALPMFSPRFQQFESIPILRLPIFLSLCSIVWFDQTAACKVDTGVAALLDVLGVVVLRLGVLEVTIFVESVVVAVVV